MSAPSSAAPARPLDGYFFEDYRPGQRYLHATPRTLTLGDSALYIALTGARQPLYCADSFAQELGYPQSPVDDLLLFHIAFGKTVPDISYNAVANLGYADCRFLQPVYAGDTIRAETEILGMRENSSGKTGVIYVRSIAYNQRAEKVLAWARWVMINKRAAGAASLGSAATPEFPAAVSKEQIVWPAFLKPSSTLMRDTGSRRLWADYQAGEFIHHPAGMTIDSSDHTLATKLYQNTARVHFDHLHMRDSRFQQRLIYGGHIISLCRALSYDGLENALSVLAINGGTHTAPTFAGDTVYARSKIIDKWTLNENFGALRIQLDGFKNRVPGNSLPASSEHAVLSLDYTLLMPRH
ncbi:MAG TPA: MaoC family dehydratase [Usitatibacteraceae bacterium]